MIEMNIAYHYGSIFWKTACLTIDSGIIGDTERGTNYGATAKALEKFRDEITPPSISKSDVGFTPDLEHQKIVYGLKPITDVNIELAKQIIENRPYSSIDDFYEKNVENGILTNKKMVTLIKSGLFDELNNNRRQIMIDYVSKINPFKEKLTTAVIPKIIDKIPNEFEQEKNYYLFFQKVKKNKTHNDLLDEYLNNWHGDCKKKTTPKYPEDSYYDDNGNFIIEVKVLEKVYKARIEKLNNWLKTDEARRIEASLRRQEFWRENCMGSIAKWEMESINFYINEHELNEYPLDKYFRIANFYDMPEEPEISKWRSGRGGKKYPVLKTYEIAGTVVDNNPQKGIAILITQYGVVQVRVGKGKFQYYHKKIMKDNGKKRTNVDDTWFKRGTKLVCVGYRRNNDFICNAINSPFEHSVMKINGKTKDEVFIQTVKKK